MAVPGLIKGQLLANDLERDGVDISVDGDLLFLGVASRSVGINTTTPGASLSVAGTTSVSSLDVNGIVYADATKTLSTNPNFRFDNGAGIVFSPNGFDVSGTVLTQGGIGSLGPFTIASPINTDVSLSPGTGGNVILNGLVYPSSDGTSGQLLGTNGSGQLSFTTVTNSFNILGDAGSDVFDMSALVVNGDGTIHTAITDNTISINVRIASTTARGVSYYDATKFNVNTAGFVTIVPNSITSTDIENNTIQTDDLALNIIGSDQIIDGSVANVDLTNSDFTIGTTNIALGDTQLDLQGLTQLTVDDIQIDGSTISSTSDMVLDPLSDGILTVNTTTGMILPAGTQAERPVTPDAGTFRYSYSTNLVEYWDGSDWVTLGDETINLTAQEIIPNGIDSVYTLDNPATTTSVLITLNGLIQIPETAYVVSNTDLIFQETPEATDIISVRFLSGVTTITGISDTTGTTEITATPAEIVMAVAGQSVMSIPSTKVVNMANSHSLQLPVYTVAAANNLTNLSPGQMIYVLNGDSGSPTLAVFDGLNWSRVALGATISAT